MGWGGVGVAKHRPIQGSPNLPLPSLSPYHHHKPNPNLCS